MKRRIGKCVYDRYKDWFVLYSHPLTLHSIYIEYNTTDQTTLNRVVKFIWEIDKVKSAYYVNE